MVTLPSRKEAKPSQEILHVKCRFMKQRLLQLINTKGKLATRAQWDARVSPPWVVFLRDRQPTVGMEFRGSHKSRIAWSYINILH